jgi:hypothetical protein
VSCLHDRGLYGLRARGGGSERTPRALHGCHLPGSRSEDVVAPPGLEDDAHVRDGGPTKVAGRGLPTLTRVSGNCARPPPAGVGVGVTVNADSTIQRAVQGVDEVS